MFLCLLFTVSFQMVIWGGMSREKQTTWEQDVCVECKINWYKLQQCHDLQQQTWLDGQCCTQASIGLFHSGRIQNMLE